MNAHQLRITAIRLLVLVMTIIGAAWLIKTSDQPPEAIAPGRRKIVFWHKWGGREKKVVDRIVERFNQSQETHFVRAIVMPGNNLDLKFFLSIAGGDPPDLLNQDQPVIADWARRGVLLPIDAFLSNEQAKRLDDWLYPAARRIGSYDGRLYGLCNGLDVRALYYNKRLLKKNGLSPPQTIAELDSLAERIRPVRKENVRLKQVGFLPDPRRLWAWGIVFGGEFYNQETGKVTVDSPEIIAALRWMTSYSERYGSRQVNEFRTGDQTLAGKTFPLLEGRYAVIMDGQWRVRDMREARNRAREDQKPVPEYGIVPLPAPPGGRENAGWVNGNFFVVPRGCKNPKGAWEFMKFWSGFDGNEFEAARTCIDGGWIPASALVTDVPSFQEYLAAEPAFAQLVILAGGEHQVPYPSVPGGAMFRDEVTRAAEQAMYRGRPPEEALRDAARHIRVRLEELTGESH